MDFMNEYGLLVAVATPVAVVGIINILLAFGGETGTLLLPSLKAYPSVLEADGAVVEAAPAEAVAPQLAEIRPAARTPVTAGFDEADEMLARQAA